MRFTVAFLACLLLSGCTEPELPNLDEPDEGNPTKSMLSNGTVIDLAAGQAAHLVMRSDGDTVCSVSYEADGSYSGSALELWAGDEAGTNFNAVYSQGASIAGASQTPDPPLGWEAGGGMGGPVGPDERLGFDIALPGTEATASVRVRCDDAVNLTVLISDHVLAMTAANVGGVGAAVGHATVAHGNWSWQAQGPGIVRGSPAPDARLWDVALHHPDGSESWTDPTQGWYVEVPPGRHLLDAQVAAEGPALLVWTAWFDVSMLPP